MVHRRVAIAPAFAGPSVGVSIGINEPGIYGRVNIGAYPQPLLVNPQPIIVSPAPIAVQRAPIYLYVPLAYQQNWPRYCNRYAACGQPVYFVREDWVRERYVHEHPGWHDRREHDRGRGHDRDDRRHDDDHRR